MILGKVFEQFLAKRPIAVMGQATLRRMLDPDRLDRLFRDNAESQYEDELLFSSLASLMADVVLRVQPSVNAARQSGDHGITVSPRSLYEKLKNTETGISEALVRDSARQAAPLIDAMGGSDPCLPGYRCRIIDGCHLAATEHRPEPLRHTWDAPLPGTALAVLDRQRMLIEDVFLIEDGHASERTALGRVAGSACEGDVWVADRNFCTLAFLFDLSDRGAHFVIRQHGSLKGELLGERARVGRGETGEVFEQRLLLEHPEDGRRMEVRRVTVELDEPTRDGDGSIHILSGLPEGDADGPKVAEVYRGRWTLEGAFGQISTTLGCEIHTLCYPKAALFAFSLGLVVYNAVGVIKAALCEAHGEEEVREGVSAYYLSLEIRNCTEGMLIAIEPPEWEVFRRSSAEEFAGWLVRTAGGIDRSRYRKHRRGPKKKPPERGPYTNGGHLSTYRVIQRSPPEQT